MWTALLLTVGMSGPAVAFDVVTDGQPMAVIVTADARADDEAKAASDLTHTLAKATGASLPVVSEANAPDGPQIHVGHTNAAAEAGLVPDGLDRDGVVMRVDDDRLFLCGGDTYSTQFAVTRFLQTHCGCRWYIPTELGEHVPTAESISVPDALNVVEEPGYLSRLWSSPSNMDPEWPRRNMIRRRYEFHHNLLDVFVMDLFDEHAEFFPLIDGERRKPARPRDHGWQPCFSNADAAVYAADTARAAFDASPDTPSFSLGINDSNTYCECEPCKALDDPDHLEFRDRPNMSNRVFHFMNAVAVELEKTHPDKYLGCLAYSWCEDVPTVPVHDRVIPYLTNDRAQWMDPEFRRLDEELIARWCAEQPIVGIYDYYYGSGYVIPRIFTKLSDESIKFAYNEGVRAFYAEIYTNWSLDGPKAWIASQLLWDPSLSRKELLNDFCSGMFAEAAEPMRDYFELCEAIWMRQKGESRWFKGFFDIDQMQIFTPRACAEARELLTRARQAAETDLTRRRVRLYSEGFHYTELYSQVYSANLTLATAQVRSKRSLARVVPTAEQLARSAAELESFYRDKFEPNDLHRSPIPFTERGTHDPVAGLMGFLTSAFAWADANDEWDSMTDLAAKLSSSDPTSSAGSLARSLIYLRDHPEAGTEAMVNGGVEEAASDGENPEGIDWVAEGMPRGWSKWIRPGTPGELVWTTAEAASGKASLGATDTEAACFIQKVPVKPGEQFLCRCAVKANVSEGARTELLVQWQDAKSDWVGARKSSAVLPAGTTDGWTSLQAYFIVPDGVDLAVIGLVTYDQEPGDYAYFDDISCLRLDIPTEIEHDSQ